LLGRQSSGGAVGETLLDREGIVKKVGCHSLPHSFATHLLEDGVVIRAVQDLPGHKSVETTRIYTQVMVGGERECGVRWIVCEQGEERN